MPTIAPRDICLFVWLRQSTEKRTQNERVRRALGIDHTLFFHSQTWFLYIHCMDAALEGIFCVYIAQKKTSVFFLHSTVRMQPVLPRLVRNAHRSVSNTRA